MADIFGFSEVIFQQRDAPAVSLSKKGCYFNKAARDLLGVGSSSLRVRLFMDKRSRRIGLCVDSGGSPFIKANDGRCSAMKRLLNELGSRQGFFEIRAVDLAPITHVVALPSEDGR